MGLFDKKKNTFFEYGLQVLAFNFNAAVIFEGYQFELHNWIKIYGIHCSFACNIQFPDLTGASETNSIFKSVISTGGTGLNINAQGSAFYQFPANYNVIFFEPLIVKRFNITKQSTAVNTYFFYKNYQI